MHRCSRLGIWTGLCVLVAILLSGTASPAGAQGPAGDVKGQSLKELMSGGGFAALNHIRASRAIGAVGQSRATKKKGREGTVIPEDNVLVAEPEDDQAPFGAGGPGGPGGGPNPNFQNAFVNDPCLDPSPTAPFPENFFRTMQSETEIAVLNDVGKGRQGQRRRWPPHGRRVQRFHGFHDNRQGLSGVSYSTDGGESWIDASGLPPKGENDVYFGDPVVAVHHGSKTFYYASIYLNAAGSFTLSVNRGSFKVAAKQVPVESRANTRCEGNPAAFGIPRSTDPA